MLSVCYILISLITGSVPLHIKDVALPNSVAAGDTAELRCKYELNDGERPDHVVVKWWHWPDTDPDNRTHIYQRVEGHKSTLVHRTPTLSILENEVDTIVLSPARPQDSGVYQCEVSVEADKEVRQSKPLYVYSPGSGPKINVSAMEDENKLLVECTVQNASPEPELKVTMNGDTVNVSAPPISMDPEGTWDLDVSVKVDPSDVDPIAFTCELLFKQNNLSHQLYIIDYTYTRNVGVSTTEADEYWTSTLEPEQMPHNVTANETGPGDGCIKLETTVLLPVVLVIVQIIYSLQNTL